MSVRRVMGTETEYAVSRPGDRYANPVRLSFDVVAAADDGTRGDILWDYRQEDPVYVYVRKLSSPVVKVFYCWGFLCPLGL